MSSVIRFIVSLPLDFLRALLKPFGYVVVRDKSTVDYFLHEYSSYEEYRDTQVKFNLQKIQNVWADEATLRRVAEIARGLPGRSNITGLCHGARNGFEQKFLNEDDRFSVLGTDISPSATDFPDSVQWDFHDENQEWIGKFDFVYTNSLDQSWQPKKAIEVWLRQLKSDGVLIIEHTELHGPVGASEMDPFGVRPVAFPYVLADWFGSSINMEFSVDKKSNKDLDSYLFVIRKSVGE